MASVVYLPHERQATLGSDIGGALGQYMAAKMQADARQQKNMQVQKFMQDVQAAPDRKAALEVVINYAPAFTTMGDFAEARRIVDQFKPESAETIHPVTMYTPEGQPTTVGMTRERLARESDPNAVGTMYPGMSLTKPTDLQNFYMPGETPGEIKFAGRLPEGKRPEGAVTLPELTEKHRAQAEAEAQKRTALQERARDLAERRFALMQDRQTAMLGRLAETLSDRDVAHAQTVVRNSTKLLGVMMNAKVLPDGSFGFDDDNKAEQYRQQVDYITAAVERNPAILKDPAAEAKLASEARKAVIGTDKKEPPKPAPKEPGPVSRIIDKVTGKGKTETPTQPKASAMTDAEKAQSRANAQAAISAINASSLAPDVKRARIEAVKKRLRDAGIGE